MESAPLYREPKNESRTLNKPLSEELRALSAVAPSILDTAQSELCAKNTIDFIGALLIPEVVEVIKTSKVASLLPPELHTFISCGNIVDMVAQNTTGAWDIHVGEMMTGIRKEGMEKKVELVTHGPFAGLLMLDESKVIGRRRAIRLLTDDFFNSNIHLRYPDLPAMTTEKNLQYLFNNLLRNAFDGLVLQAAGRRVERNDNLQYYIEEKPPAILLSDLLQLQCQKMGIPFDKHELHMYGPKPSKKTHM